MNLWKGELGHICHFVCGVFTCYAMSAYLVVA